MPRNANTAVNSHTKQYLDEEAAGKMCLSSKRTMQQWRWRKIGPKYIKLGSGVKGKGKILYDYDDIVAWMESQKVKTNPEV
ncbi:MAG: hypothetical protein A4E60_01686 [Syntrophorhabdus sp. PtaB.Bin047]|jgi:hypothetical protein|nr:MAG: hypothetical protein A4E60_01686 [Syntrophorhabdus sp. PtaB.Bin047]